MEQHFDAVVVGTGPNGLAAAITLAQAGCSVAAFEAAPTVGGGVRSAERTLPGFVHDVCSAIHPFGRASPFFAGVSLEEFGLRWIDAPSPLGHPLDGGQAIVVERDVDATAARLGRDGRAYERLVGPLARDWTKLLPDVLAPLHVPWPPDRTLRMARFGLDAIQPAVLLGRRFHEPQARALLAGCAAHSFLPFTAPVSGAIGLTLLVSAHALGWAFPEGGAGKIGEALASQLRALGGVIFTSRPVDRLDELPAHRVALFDVTPRQLLRIAGDRMDGPGGLYRRELERYRYGPGVFKLDVAIEGEIPWQNPELRRCGCVHLGGTFEEIAASEAQRVAALRARGSGGPTSRANSSRITS